jgi:DNA-directed RNA polymerase specialized sigma24 family protein
MAAATKRLLAHLMQLTAQAAPDALLLERWREHKDQSAFSSLVRRHGPMVLAVCRRVLSDWQHAEDAFQATFLILARKAGSIRQPEALASFLHGVALRLARKSRKQAACRAVATRCLSAEPVHPRPHPLDALSGRELLSVVDAEVERSELLSLMDWR